MLFTVSKNHQSERSLNRNWWIDCVREYAKTNRRNRREATKGESKTKQFCCRKNNKFIYWFYFVKHWAMEKRCAINWFARSLHRFLRKKRRTKLILFHIGRCESSVLRDCLSNTNIESEEIECEAWMKRQIEMINDSWANGKIASRRNIGQYENYVLIKWLIISHWCNWRKKSILFIVSILMKWASNGRKWNVSFTRSTIMRHECVYRWNVVAIVWQIDRNKNYKQINGKLIHDNVRCIEIRNRISSLRESCVRLIVF